VLEKLCKGYKGFLPYRKFSKNRILYIEANTLECLAKGWVNDRFI